MGSDREARALAAGETITVEGKEYRLRPVMAQHLCDLERDALRAYKREYLQTYRDNADLLGDGTEGCDLVREKMDEVARWDIHDLPQKDVYDVSNIPVTDKLRKWLLDEFGLEVVGEEADLEVEERRARAVLSTAIDMGKIKSGKVKELTGKLPVRGRVRYDQWWVTACIGGMVSFITSSIQRDHPEMTREKVQGWNYTKVIEAARLVESLTAAAIKNG